MLQEKIRLYFPFQPTVEQDQNNHAISEFVATIEIGVSLC